MRRRFCSATRETIFDFFKGVDTGRVGWSKQHPKKRHFLPVTTVLQKRNRQGFKGAPIPSIARSWPFVFHVSTIYDSKPGRCFCGAAPPWLSLACLCSRVGAGSPQQEAGHGGVGVPSRPTALPRPQPRAQALGGLEEHGRGTPLGVSDDP